MLSRIPVSGRELWQFVRQGSFSYSQLLKNVAQICYSLEDGVIKYL